MITNILYHLLEWLVYVKYFRNVSYAKKDLCKYNFKTTKNKWMCGLKSLVFSLCLLSSVFVIHSVFQRTDKRRFGRRRRYATSFCSWVKDCNSYKSFHYLPFIMFVMDAGSLDPFNNRVKGKEWWKLISTTININPLLGQQITKPFHELIIRWKCSTNHITGSSYKENDEKVQWQLEKKTHTPFFPPTFWSL